MDLTHSHPIYSLHYPTSPEYIFLSLFSGNQVIETLILIDRETSSLSDNRVAGTLTPTITQKPRETDKHGLVLLLI